MDGGWALSVVDGDVCLRCWTEGGVGTGVHRNGVGSYGDRVGDNGRF